MANKMYCLLIYVLYHISFASSEHINIFMKTIRYVQQENENEFYNMMILSDIQHRQKDEHAMQQNIRQFIHSQSYIFWSEITVHNLKLFGKTIELKNTLNSFTPTLILIFDFASSNAIQKKVSELSQEHLRNNTWLIITKGDNSLSNVKSFFEDNKHFNEINVALDTQLYISKMNNSHATLFEIYKPCKEHLILVTEIATLNDLQIDDEVQNSIWIRRSNLMGCTLRVAYVDMLPYISWLNESNTKLDEYPHVFKSGGVTMVGNKLNEIEMLKLLATDLNITTTWVRAKDDSFGVYNQKTKVWNGIVRLLLDDEADLSNAYLTITKRRSSAVSFTSGFVQAEFGLFMKKPRLSSSWSTYVDVFYTKYWLILICVALSVAIILGSSLYVFEHIWKRRRISSTSKHFITNIGSGVAVMMLSFASQDIAIGKSFHRSKTNSIKMLLLTACLFGAMNYYVYNAGLTSTLITKHYHSEIKSLSDLVDKPQYKLILRKGTANIQYFSDETNFPHKQIWENILKDKENSIVSSFETAENDILEDHRKVYFDTIHNVELAFRTFPCDIVRSPNTYFHRSVALAFRKGSPYVKLFSSRIRDYKEYGLIDHMHGLKRNAKGNVNCPQDEMNELGYENIFSSFVLLGSGVLLAIINFCVEYLFCKRNH